MVISITFFFFYVALPSGHLHQVLQPEFCTFLVCPICATSCHSSCVIFADWAEDTVNGTFLCVFRVGQQVYVQFYVL